MISPLKGRSLLTLVDFSTSEIRYLLDLAHEVKRERRAGQIRQRFIGKTLALIFEKPSTRTRCAFETAFAEEGGHPTYLAKNDIQLGFKETVEDTARVLGRMFSAIQFRGFKQDTVEALAKYSGVPVYNGLTDIFHPTQVLADLMTMEESWGTLEGRKLVYAGDGRNNMANSLLVGCARMGVHLTISAPKSLFPDSGIYKQALELAKETGARLELTDNFNEALKGADALYTDVWASMGEEDQLAERKKILGPYQISKTAMVATGNPECIFLHCLPAVRENEVTAEVFDGDRSRVWDQAENRKHTIKALMLATI